MLPGTPAFAEFAEIAKQAIVKVVPMPTEPFLASFSIFRTEHFPGIQAHLEIMLKILESPPLEGPALLVNPFRPQS